MLLAGRRKVFAQFLSRSRVERHEFDRQPVRRCFSATHIGRFAAGLIERVAIDARAEGGERNRTAAMRCGKADRRAVSGAQQFPRLRFRRGPAIELHGLKPLI